MLGVAIVTVLVLAVLLGVAAYVVREHIARRERVDDVLLDPRTPTLDYEVPTGQDPAVLLGALEKEGYTATVDPHGAHQVVLVQCPGGLEAHREDVRSVIESANVTSVDDGIPLRVDVRFRDER